MMNKTFVFFFCLFMMLSLAACQDEIPEKEPPARPVTYLVLKESNPARLTRLTGSVEAWKREMLSSRVEGRLTNVVEPGVTIEGRILNDDGEVERPGTLLATLQRDRHLLRRDEAAAGVSLAKARAQQARTELERMIPERIKAAKALLARKTKEYQRQKTLLPQGATSQSRFEEVEKDVRQAAAALAKAEAEQSTKAAELDALIAEVAGAEQVLRRAEVNLAECELYSPFSGQVARVHGIEGTFLLEGMPILTVQMMDPVKVEVAVSQETDSQVQFNQLVDVYLAGSDEPVPGMVYLKDTTADAATRTFNITILVRNRIIETDLPQEYQQQDLPRTTDLLSLESENADGKPPFYTEERTIHTDADGSTFVWQAVGLTLADLRGDFNPVFTVKKVPVTPGDNFIHVLQVYRYQELTEFGSLDPQKDVVMGKLPAGVKDGDKVFLSREEWLLRPGQLVQVELRGQSSQPGFYVPRPAILLAGGKHYVFVVDEVGAGQEQAKRVAVQVGELLGDYRRIESIGEGGLSSGSKVILDGVHYLRDGDLINAFDEIEVSL
jgi:hypothetical protein